MTWLILKTEGEFQERIRRFALPIAISLVVAVSYLSIWTLFLHKDISERWFSWPTMLYLSPVPILTGAMFLGLFLSIRSKHEALPFVFSLGVFVFSFAGLGISLAPDVVPPDISIWDAAAPKTSLWFLLVGAVVLLPIILVYTAHSYWVFRGKVRLGDTYH